MNRKDFLTKLPLMGLGVILFHLFIWEKKEISGIYLGENKLIISGNIRGFINQTK